VKPVHIWVTILGWLLPTVLSAQGFDDADFDHNGQIDLADFLALSAQYGLSKGDTGYDARYDLNLDGHVNFQDFLIFSRFYGQKRPDISVALHDLLVGAEVQMKAEGLSELPVGMLLPKLDAEADRTALQDIAGSDGNLSIDEAKFALGEPVLSDAVSGALQAAKVQMQIQDAASLPVNDLLGLVATEEDRAPARGADFQRVLHVEI